MLLVLVLVLRGTFLPLSKAGGAGGQRCATQASFRFIPTSLCKHPHHPEGANPPELLTQSIRNPNQLITYPFILQYSQKLNHDPGE